MVHSRCVLICFLVVCGGAVLVLGVVNLASGDREKLRMKDVELWWSEWRGYRSKGNGMWV